MEIAEAFGFCLIGDLGKYLGVPLRHNRTSSNSFSFVTDKLLQRMSSWKATTLSLAGRITLCSSVLSATPIYQMQTAFLPLAVC